MRYLLLACAGLSFAADPPKTTFETLPGYTLSNGKLELTVLEQGASMPKLILVNDAAKVNPLWEPVRLAREANQPPRFGASIGHFVCVDGFGPSSKEEQAAGLQFHGEAHRTKLDVKSYTKEKGRTRLALAATLPLAQELFTRVIEMVDGENVVYVRSRLDSGVAFDRPVVWAEHATIGAPFLEPGITVVDAPAVKARTRPYEASTGPVPHRLASDKEFTWPMAPTTAGRPVDIRAAPAKPNSGDHTTALMDRTRKYVYVTALHPVKKLVVGWVFKSDEFPWLQNWEYYPSNGMYARGLEFSTQPFDVPRRESVTLGRMFDAPTFRWLPAKSAIESSFLMFYTPAPDGMTRVDDVRLEGGKLVIEDKKARKSIALAASLEL